MAQTLLISDGVEAVKHNKLLVLWRLCNYEDSGTLWHFNVQALTDCRQPIYDKVDSALPCLNKLEIPCCKPCLFLSQAKQVKIVWLKISYDHKMSESQVPFSVRATSWMFSYRVNCISSSVLIYSEGLSALPYILPNAMKLQYFSRPAL